MRLIISNIINTPNAIIQKFGLEVFGEVFQIVSNDSNACIELSFEGLENVTSGFCNAAIGNLYKNLGENLNNQVVFTDVSNPNWQRRIDRAKELALNNNKSKAIDDAFAELF